MKTNLSSMLSKALELQNAILADQGARPVAMLAADLALPQTTAYRIVSALLDQGMLIRDERGRYFAGPRLLAQLQSVDPVATLASVSAPFVRRLAKACRQVAHLGVLEADMVTYVVKAGAGPIAGFTRQGKQLEAYCSGVGKVLLASLPKDELELYLSSAPFVRLTPQTIVDPDALRAHLDTVREQGFALDLSEIAENLNCIAVPVPDSKGSIRAALSVSAPSSQFDGAFRKKAHACLKQCSFAISSAMYPEL